VFLGLVAAADAVPAAAAPAAATIATTTFTISNSAAMVEASKSTGVVLVPAHLMARRSCAKIGAANKLSLRLAA
jgi:hypothetical protein